MFNVNTCAGAENLAREMGFGAYAWRPVVQRSYLARLNELLDAAGALFGWCEQEDRGCRHNGHRNQVLIGVVVQIRIDEPVRRGRAGMGKKDRIPIWLGRFNGIHSDLSACSRLVLDDDRLIARLWRRGLTENPRKMSGS